MLPKATSTIRGWVIKAFKTKKDKLRKELKGTYSTILILFNLWTSLTAFRVLNIITYFISNTGKCHYVVLGLYKVVSKYSSKNIAAVLLKIFKDYQISNNIGYFIADNAESNNIYIKVILQALYLGILVKKQKACWLYYFSYITNLYMQAFIVGPNTKNIYKKLSTAYYNHNFKKIEQL